MDSKLRKQLSDEEQNTLSKEKKSKRERKIESMPVESLLEGSPETDDCRKPEKKKRSKKKKKDKEEGTTVHQEAHEDDGDTDERTQADNDSGKQNNGDKVLQFRKNLLTKRELNNKDLLSTSETNFEENKNDSKQRKMKNSSDSHEETQTMEIIGETVIDSNLTEGKGKKKKKKKKTPDSAVEEQILEEELIFEQTHGVVHEVVIQSSIVAESLCEDPKKKKKKKKNPSSPLEEKNNEIPSETETSEIINEITIQSSVAEENVNEDQRKKKKKKKKPSSGEERIVEESQAAGETRLDQNNVAFENVGEDKGKKKKKRSSGSSEEEQISSQHVDTQTKEADCATIVQSIEPVENFNEDQRKKMKKKKKRLSSEVEEMTAEQSQMKIQSVNVVVEKIKDDDVLEEAMDESQGKKKKKNKKKYVSDVDGKQTMEISEVNLETENVVFETKDNRMLEEEVLSEGQEKKKKKQNKHSDPGEEQIVEISEVNLQTGDVVLETTMDSSIPEEDIDENQRKKKKKKKRKMSDSGEEVQILEHVEVPKPTDDITIETVIDSSIPEEKLSEDQGRKKKKRKKRKMSDSREEEAVLEQTEDQRQMEEIIVETFIDSNVPEESFIESQVKRKKVTDDQQNTETIIESEVQEQFEISPKEVIVPEESGQAVNNDEHESVIDVLESLKAVIESAFFKPAEGNNDNNPAEQTFEVSKTEEEENRHPFDLLENPEIMSKLELDRPKELTNRHDVKENVNEQDIAVASIEQGGIEAIDEQHVAADSEMAEAVNQIKPEPTFTEATIKAVDASGNLITIPVRLENVKTYIIRTDPNATRNTVRPMVKPSELHSWVLTEEDKKNLKSKGLQIEYGRWSKRESDILKRNVESFCDLAKVDSEGFRKMIFDDSSLAKKTRSDIGFYSKLADGISRPLREVYRKLRQLYDPDNYKGKFSAAEKHTLIALQKKYGNEWSRIGEEMGRSGASVMRKFRRLCLMPVKGVKSAVSAAGGQEKVAIGDKEAAGGENEAAVAENEAEGKTDESSNGAKGGVLSHGRWTKEETDRLKTAVLKLCGDEKTNEIDERVLHWDAISHMVGTRNSEQCRRKWQLQLKWKDPSEKTKKWTQEDNARFIVALSRCEKEDERLVEWERIAEAMGKFASPEFMKKKWYGFKIMAPDYHSLDFKEVLDWLLKNYVDQLRARFPAWNL